MTEPSIIEHMKELKMMPSGNEAASVTIASRLGTQRKTNRYIEVSKKVCESAIVSRDGSANQG